MKIQSKLISLCLTLCCFALFTQTIYSRVLTSSKNGKDVVLEKLIEYTVDLNDTSKANNAIKNINVLLKQINKSRADSFFDFINKAWLNSVDSKIEKNLIAMLLKEAIAKKQFFNENQQKNLARFKYIIEDEIQKAFKIEILKTKALTSDEIKQKFGKLINTIKRLTLNDPKLYRQASRNAMAKGLILLKDNRNITKGNAPLLLEFVSLVENKQDHPLLMNLDKIKQNVTEILDFKTQLEELVKPPETEEKAKTIELMPMPEFIEEKPIDKKLEEIKKEK